jgi:hypothetical protein
MNALIGGALRVAVVRFAADISEAKFLMSDTIVCQSAWPKGV